MLLCRRVRCANDKNMSSAIKNRDNPFGWTTTVIICKRWFKPSEALLIFIVINLKIMDLLVYLIGVLVAFFIGYLIGNKQLE